MRSSTITGYDRSSLSGHLVKRQARADLATWKMIYGKVLLSLTKTSIANKTQGGEPFK